MPGCRLDRDERARIEAGVESGATDTEIAATLKRHRTTVSREIIAEGGRANYREADAHRGGVLWNAEGAPVQAKCLCRAARGQDVVSLLGNGSFGWSVAVGEVKQVALLPATRKGTFL